MIRKHRPGEDTFDDYPRERFARLNPTRMLDEGDTPTRVLGVVDEWGKPQDCFGSGLLTNGTLGVDLLNIPPNSRFPLHTHPGHHLLYCLAGAGTFTLNEVVYDIVPGDLFMVEGMVPHAVGSGPDEHHVILAYGSPHTVLGSPERMTVIMEDDSATGAAIRATMEADGVKVVSPEEVHQWLD